MDLFKRLFQSLNRASVKYLVVGGIAVNLYGIQRATADIDVVIHLEEDNVEKFTGVASALGLKPKAPVPLDRFRNKEQRAVWIRDKSMKVFSFYDTGAPFFLLDVFIEEPFDFELVYKSRKIFEIDGIPIPVVSIADLIAMKESSDRPQDRADIHFLKKIMLDWTDEE